VTVLAVRGPAADSAGLVVLGSTFGRHGKKADADDMKIFAATAPVSGIYSNGKRFGVDLPLHDAAGRTVGTMNVGYAYRAGDDHAALTARAERLRAEIEPRIAAASQLGELDP
jgi:iron complex outermembrane receptor protein